MGADPLQERLEGPIAEAAGRIQKEMGVDINHLPAPGPKDCEAERIKFICSNPIPPDAAIPTHSDNPLVQAQIEAGKRQLAFLREQFDRLCKQPDNK